MTLRHPISKIILGISLTIYAFSCSIVFSTKDNIEHIVKDLGMQPAQSTSIFIDYGYTLAVITMLFMAVQILIEYSNMKQKLKVKIFTASSFIGLAIIAFYIIAVFMPFISITTSLGSEVM